MSGSTAASAATARSAAAWCCPGAADSEVGAELKDGVLTLTVSVPERARPKQIEIKAG